MGQPKYDLDLPLYLLDRHEIFRNREFPTIVAPCDLVIRLESAAIGKRVPSFSTDQFREYLSRIVADDEHITAIKALYLQEAI